MTERQMPILLVVDDEPFMLKLIIHMLANLGFFQVTGCSSGQAALEWVDQSDSPPDIILCDLNMPEMDGIEFLRKLVEHGYGGSLILVSGEGERMLQTVEVLALAHHIKLLGHLNKPVPPAALAAMLEKWSPVSPRIRRTVEQVYGADAVRDAIANDELVNYYQPKVAVASGRVIGVEALVRWRHPRDGMVFPDRFIGVAEEHGLIDELTRVVMIGALAQTKIWQDAGLMLRVAINISMDNLSSVEFVNHVVGQTAAAGVTPRDVVLEVTESRLMKDIRAPLEILTRLRMQRFRLSIDDFGTGHSSLSQLRDIPFDELKIDRGFVHGAWANQTVQTIYDASLRLARQFGMETVAEGVEDQEDWEFLRRTGCDLAQGYFIAKPMPAADLPGWIEVWQGREREWAAVVA
ncbi:MAG: EAL domain-containing response regulator [Magnetococcales bacterium]|nr:EAL domain-containing response regulator [Magnetococcales bacterium]